MTMVSIGIFFGSDTGNTEQIANRIQQQLQCHHHSSTVQDVAVSNVADIERYSLLIFGIPTWYYGEPQCDWDDFFATLQTINLSQQEVALFGCGDQEDYADYFCDAMGILGEIVRRQGGRIIGYWPTMGYQFAASKALVDSQHFIGLVLDEDRQAELTEQRVKAWVAQICQQSRYLSTPTSEQ